ncbi:MAG: hypothetical protein U9Q82_07170 [Chloroflexota bacterium]|nr:hypothetical protein [Chloroflexota bacterium]
MKPLSAMNREQLAAYIQTWLRDKGIDAVLTGGSVVSIYSGNRYVSKDLDFVITGFVRRSKVKKAMEEIRFEQIGRYFEHSQVDLLVEFPGGPLSVGDQKVQEIKTLEYDTGTLKLLSPTDCVKDRLAAYYHWGDRQSLIQALMVAQDHKINLDEIAQWSKGEGKGDEYKKIEEKIRQASR